MPIRIPVVHNPDQKRLERLQAGDQLPVEGLPTEVLLESDVVDDLLSTSDVAPLSANQGRVLRDLIIRSTVRIHAVIDVVPAEDAPPSENEGDRYILQTGTVAHADWDGALAGDIVEFASGSWTALTPVEGMAAYVDAQDNLDAVFVDDGAPAWELRPASVTVHSGLTGLEVDDHAQYLTEGRADSWLAAGHETDYDHTLLSGVVEAVKTLHVDVNRTDVYTQTGAQSFPFKTIQAAIDRIVANDDNALNPYDVQIANGKYYENVVIEDLKIHRITLSGNGVVQIRPVAGSALQSTANNTNLKQFHVRRIVFLAPVVITGANGSLAFDDVIWDDCAFAPGEGAQAGVLNLTCINSFSARRSFHYASNVVLNNVNYALLDHCSIGSGSTVGLSMDSGANLPSWGATGGLVVVGSVLSGTPTLALAGPVQNYNLVVNSSRVAGPASAVTIPAGLVVAVFNSHFRGTWTNAGVLSLKNSHVQNLAGIAPVLEQPASQLGNDSTVVGSTVKDALETLLGLAVIATEAVAAPAAPDSPGTEGQWAYDSNYLYKCVATNTWVRTAVESVWS